MANTFTIYKYRNSVPPLCCATLPPATPGDPRYAGQIGCFPVCGDATKYLVTCDPQENGELVHTGACERHILDLRGQMQRWIIEIEEYETPSWVRLASSDPGGF